MKKDNKFHHGYGNPGFEDVHINIEEPPFPIESYNWLRDDNTLKCYGESDLYFFHDGRRRLDKERHCEVLEDELGLCNKKIRKECLKKGIEKMERHLEGCKNIYKQELAKQ